MKAYGIVLITILLLAAANLLIVSAQENQETGSDTIALTTSESPETSELNDNLEGDASGLRIGWEKAKLWFTFNQEKKAERELKLARLYLIKAKVAALNNNDNAVENAILAHNRILEGVQDRIELISADKDSGVIKSSAVKLVGLERAIEVHEARIQRLNEILNTANLTEKQLDKVEERVGKLETRVEKLREIQQKKEEQLKVKLRAITNKTEQEIEQEISELKEAKNLSKFKQRAAEIRIQEAEKAIAKFRGFVSNAKEKGRNITDAEARIADAEEILAEAKTLYNAGDYILAIETLKPIWNYGRMVAYEVRLEKAEKAKERLQELKEQAREENKTVKEIVIAKARERVKERAGK